MPYIARLIIAHLLNNKYPGYSGCQRCLRVWPLCRAHTTVYKVSENGEEGCFALCEACWRDLPPDERLYYYERLVAEWKAQSLLWWMGNKVEEMEETWNQIKTAVLAGK
jgi:hypothetical protein